MANKNPSKKFEKGHKHSPGGRKGALPIPKLAKVFNRAKLEAVISKYIDMPMSELMGKVADQSIPSLDHMVIATIVSAVADCNFRAFDFILERMVGKVKDTVDMQSSDGSMSPLTDAQRLAVAKRIVKNSEGK